jgi:hypothetical protein
MPLHLARFRLQNRLYFLAGQESEQGLVEPLHWDGEDPLDTGERSRVTMAGVVQEGP